jgi:hypothetical protein
MSEKKITIGQAIDQIVEALQSMEPAGRIAALEAACSYLGINSVIKENPEVANTSYPPSLTPVNNTSPSKQIDIRSFKEEKNPTSASQMACVVAFYLQELAPQTERKNSISAADLTKYFKQAGFKLPSAMNQLLLDAKSSGYLDSTSAKGEYSLNAVGYNLVAHNLPKKSSK